MNYSDVMLWFAKDKNGNIVTINEVDKQENHTYYCPLCGSEVIPRQGEIQSWCFAHIDKSKCTSESMYHFWVKNKLLEKGDKFIVKSDVEREYVCKDILVEKSYDVEGKTYRPDLTVLTECGKTIYFEMDYTNTKKIEDYIDIWMGLGNVVVEVDIKTLVNSKSEKLPMYKAKYYNGKCFNVKKSKDIIYYETIGKCKEKTMKRNEYEKKKKEIEKLDWLWEDIQNYKIDKVNIEYISKLIQSIEYEDHKDVVVRVLRRSSCNQIIKDYVKYNCEYVEKILKSFNMNNDNKIKHGMKIPHKIYDRLFNFKVNFTYKNSCYVYKNVDFFTEKSLNDTVSKIEDEINEENKISKEIRKIKKYVNDKNNKYNYSNLCKYIKLINEPYVSISKSIHPSGAYGIKYKHTLYLHNLINCKHNEYITIEKYDDINNIYKFIDRKASYDTYRYFSKEDIMYIDDVAKKICENFNKDDIGIHFDVIDRKDIQIRIMYKGYTKKIIEINKDRYFYAKNLYTHIYILIKIEVNKIMDYIKKVEIIEGIIGNINKKLEHNESTDDWSISSSLDLYRYHWRVKLNLTYKNNRNYLYDFSCKTQNIIDKYLNEGIKITDNYMRKKVKDIITHKALECAYSKIRKKKYVPNLKEIRNYKVEIIKNLKKNDFDILKVNPMCNKPYIKIQYENKLSHIIFLSEYDYDNYGIHDEKCDILTILNDKSSEYIETLGNRIIIGKDNKYNLIHRSELLKTIIKDKIKKVKEANCNKDIKLFYHKSKPKNKKYKNLNSFNFVKAIDILEFSNNHNSSLNAFGENIRELVFDLPYYLSHEDIVNFKYNIFNQKDFNDLFNMFFKVVSTIKNNEINILLGIKWTNLDNRGYQPWLINDFIDELEIAGFSNVTNTKSK